MPPKRKHVESDEELYGLVPEDSHPSYFLQPLSEPKEAVTWERSVKHLYRFITHQDGGSSIVHTCLNAIYKPYRNGKLHSLDISQVEMVAMFRRELAQALGVEKSPGVQYAHLLCNGAWVADLTTDIENMYLRLANPGCEFDDIMIEHLSNVLNIDLYIISAESRELLTNVPLIRYQKRSSVVILQLRKHYELLGLVLPTGEHVTHFDHSYPWIQRLYQQIVRQ